MKTDNWKAKNIYQNIKHTKLKITNETREKEILFSIFSRFILLFIVRLFFGLECTLSQENRKCLKPYQTQHRIFICEDFLACFMLPFFAGSYSARACERERKLYEKRHKAKTRKKNRFSLKNYETFRVPFVSLLPPPISPHQPPTRPLAQREPTHRTRTHSSAPNSAFYCSLE